MAVAVFIDVAVWQTFFGWFLRFHAHSIYFIVSIDTLTVLAIKILVLKVAGVFNGNHGSGGTTIAGMSRHVVLVVIVIVILVRFIVVILVLLIVIVGVLVMLVVVLIGILAVSILIILVALIHLVLQSFVK